MPEVIRSIAVVSTNAGSLVNFRGPLLTEMAARGLTVWALAPDYDDALRERVRSFGAQPVDIRMERTGMRPLRDAADMLRLRATLTRLEPDATLAYFIKPVIYGSLAAKAAGVPRRYALMAGLGYVFTPPPGGESLKRRALRLMVSRLYKAGFSACRRVFFHNGDDLDYVSQAGLIDRSKAVLIDGTGVDLSRFPITPPSTDPLRFLLIARLLAEKGVREYVEAAKAIRRNRPEVEFHLAGDLDTNPGALSRNEVEAWVSAGDIIWHGHVVDVREIIAAASVYVLPSYREGKPRSTQEAMAMGRPVVTTDAPGCRDTVDEGVNGFKVPVGDAEALAKAMRRFIDNPTLIGKMGRESRRLAEERFDVDKINDMILSVILA